MHGCRYFEPSVIYNRRLRLYVLWMLADVVPGPAHANEPGAPKKHNAVSATAATPAGPFVLHAPQWAQANGTAATTDAYPVVSADGGKAWLKTNLRRPPFGSYVAELDETFAQTAPGRTSNVVGGELCSANDFEEGGGLLEHAGSWWLMSGRNGCMDGRGADVRVWRAPGPLGPYAYFGEAAAFVNGSNSTNGPGRGYSPTRAQQFGVAVINGRALYQGVRWHHAAALPFAIANQPVWLPFNFSGGNGAAGSGPTAVKVEYAARVVVPPRRIRWADGFIDALVGRRAAITRFSSQQPPPA